MCLNKANRIFPDDNIICYKVVIVKNIYNQKVIKSPYMPKKWVLNRTENLHGRMDLPLRHGYLGDYIIDGAYHSYKNRCDAEEHIKLYFHPKTRKYARVVKCIIPKTSHYVYEGVTDTGRDSYASQKLKPIELL